MLVGITGPAGAGKDTAADQLLRLNFVKASFALPLKRALSAMFGVDFVNMSREDKEAPLEPLGVSPRYLMQTLGTEWGRELIDEDIWVNALGMLIDEQPLNYVISDLRFENEVDMIKWRGGMVVYLMRSGLPEVEPHASENSVHPSDTDMIIVNDGTIAELGEKMVSAVREFF